MKVVEADEPRPDLEAEFPGWAIISRRFADGWHLCAFYGGKATFGRMPDITRQTEADPGEAICDVTGEPALIHLLTESECWCLSPSSQTSGIC